MTDHGSATTNIEISGTATTGKLVTKFTYIILNGIMVCERKQ